MNFWRNYRYKHITFLVLILLGVYFLLKTGIFDIILNPLNEWSYLGALLGGIFYVSTFTVSIGSIILVSLLKHLTILEISLIAAIGAMIGDVFILRIVRDEGLIHEMRHILGFFGWRRVTTFFSQPYMQWFLPVLGIFIIASPLPDEIGVSLLGISQMKSYQFLLLTFILNFLGIYALVYAASLVIL